MYQEDWIDQIRQILQWLLDDERFREFFFDNLEEAIAYLNESGYEFLEETKRHLRGKWRVTPDNFEERYEWFSEQFVTKSGAKRPDPTLPLPQPEQANGGDGHDQPPKRIVNTGFASETEPAEPIVPSTPLATETGYYFWLEVGERIEGAIQSEDHELPIEELPPEAQLDVVLFAFDGGIGITPGKDVGQIRIMPNGTVQVASRAAEPEVGDDLLTRRLFFPVRTPDEAGTYHMRCNIYFQQTLVQSWYVTAEVTTDPTPREEPALTAAMDYTLSRALDGRQLQGMGVNRLSIMLNDNGNGTHGFRFFGEGEFKNDATFDGHELQDLVQTARGAMRKAAWGDEEPYKKGKSYLYGEKIDEARLRDNLVTLAIRGYRFYTTLIGRLAGDVEKAWGLAELMAAPGQVQIASKQSARLVIPVAMFYDYELNDGKLSSEYSICPAFLDALKGNEPLEKTSCFQGDCPTREQDMVICPSGFWGFRHSIGLPVSVKEALDAPVEIASSNGAKIDIGVSTDPNFEKRPQHEQNIAAMGFDGQYADTRDGALAMMKKTQSQVVYFYCHGGFANGVPFISVGPPSGDWLTPPNLFQKKIRWRSIRPLVFINGCHTTDLTPEHAMDFVTAFVTTSNAAGVIGTEITIFEPVAVAFAEEFFRRFLGKQRQTVGEAVRGARLKMLKEGNPLGLVYIPYVLPGLKLSKT